MSAAISLRVVHSQRAKGPIEGFRFLWAFYVNGFRPDRRCQQCFKGKRARNFSAATARIGATVEFHDVGRYPFLYVCGVGSGPKRDLASKNFHWPLRYEPGRVATARTYNGYVLTAQNAVALPIPALPDGWRGRDAETTRCRNFRFAAAWFGAPIEAGSARPPRLSRRSRAAP